jgi:hypothetical protein
MGHAIDEVKWFFPGNLSAFGRRAGCKMHLSISVSIDGTPLADGTTDGLLIMGIMGA